MPRTLQRNSVKEQQMKINMIAFTEKGMALGKRLQELLHHKGNSISLSSGKKEHTNLSKWTEESFKEAGALIFIGATGIAVRAIAPFMKSKTVDPAVIVIDEKGCFVISLLSGHLGGANALTEEISKLIEGIPVITTATDINNVFAVDIWAKKNNLSIANPEKIAPISAKILSGKNIYIKSLYEIKGKIPKGVQLEGTQPDVIISPYKIKEDALHLIPKSLCLGIGCRKDMAAEKMEKAFAELLSLSEIHEKAIFKIATIDLKKEEKAILHLSEKHTIPLVIFTSQELMAAKGDFVSSDFVKSVTGVDNVCERSAVLGNNGRLIFRKRAFDGITMALSEGNYNIDFEV